MKVGRTHLRGEHDQVLPAAGLDPRFDFEARPEDFAPDGFHPSGESYARIAREIAARHAAELAGASAAAAV